MSEREEDLDAELEELVDSDEYPEVEDVGALDDIESDRSSDQGADLETEFDDLGLEHGRDAAGSIDPATTTERTRTDSGSPGRIRSWLGSLFSTRWFGAAAVASVVGVLAAGAIPLPFTGYVGILLAGAAIGLATSDRRYLEVATAGAITAALATVFNVIGLVLLAVGIPLVVIAGILGALAGTIGHYAGRDLRHGLTRDL